MLTSCDIGDSPDSWVVEHEEQGTNDALGYRVGITPRMQNVP